MNRKHAYATVLATLMIAGVGADAHASTALIGPGDELRYLAGDGETNDLQIKSNGVANQVVVLDPGATIKAGPGCAAVANNVHAVTCPTELTASISLGDNSDRANID